MEQKGGGFSWLLDSSRRWLIGSNRVESSPETSSMRSFRVLNFNYSKASAEGEGSKRRAIYR